MTTSFLALPLLTMLAGAPQAASALPPPRTVGSVDLTKFGGTYYEIARVPNKFQVQCAGDVTATYAVRRDGRIDVVNRCRRTDGVIDEARGVAKRTPGDDSNAKLKVRFAPAWLALLPKVWGDYWILALGPEYSYVVVGDPWRRYLWILSRAPHMPELAYKQALEIVKSNGYELSQLVLTAQGK